MEIIHLKYSGLISLAFFLLLLVLEAFWPLRRRKRRRGPRLVINLLLTALAFVAGAGAVRPLALGLAFWTQTVPFGLLHLIDLPWQAQFALGFLWMDLTFYYWHRLNHTRPLLWRFHCVHHVDPDLDVSTSFRFHVGEVLYSVVFRILQVGAVGLSPVTYLAYELAFNLETMFHHSNLRLPVRVERLLNKIIVTPRMHGIHHSAVGAETNSNYSVIFSWWDRLNRSLRLNVPQRDIIIGVPGYLLAPDNGWRRLVAQPFVKQKPYWRWPSGKAAVRKPTAGAEEPQVLLE